MVAVQCIVWLHQDDHLPRTRLVHASGSMIFQRIYEHGTTLMVNTGAGCEGRCIHGNPNKAEKERLGHEGFMVSPAALNRLGHNDP